MVSPRPPSTFGRQRLFLLLLHVLLLLLQLLLLPRSHPSPTFNSVLHRMWCMYVNVCCARLHVPLTIHLCIHEYTCTYTNTNAIHISCHCPTPPVHAQATAHAIAQIQMCIAGQQLTPLPTPHVHACIDGQQLTPLPTSKWPATAHAIAQIQMAHQDLRRVVVREPAGRRRPSKAHHVIKQHGIQLSGRDTPEADTPEVDLQGHAVSPLVRASP